MSSVLVDGKGQGDPEIKSLDKLEIQMEEQTLAQKKEAEGGNINGTTIQNGDQHSEDDPTVEVVPEDPSKSTPSKSVKKSKLTVKIPQILRRRPKERPPPSEEETKNGDDEKMTEVPEMVTTDNDPTGELKSTLNELKSGDEGQSKEGGANGVAPVDMDVSSSTSFLSTFSTPRWTNFRRVFSFNRSTPAPTAQEKTMEAVIPVSVILNIGEESIKDGKETMETESSGHVETKDESMGPQMEKNGQIHQDKKFMSPFLRIFTRSLRTTKDAQRDLDLESGVTGTELVEKSSIGQEIEKTEKPTPVKEEPDGKISAEKGSVEESGIPDEKKSVPNGVDPPAKCYALWRDSLGMSDRKKLIFAGISGVLLLLVTFLVIFFCQTSRAIDIGSLIIGGKFINTITSCGHVQGVLEDGGYVFRGIPYAVPPVGELRWKSAQMHSHLSHCWNGTLDAKKHAMPCWQWYRNGSYDGSEDCLYLDIYTPKPYYDSPLPVVVYIGGESLNGGESTTLKPSVKTAVRKNVVFVSVSIRRSVLGFLTLDVLSRNSYPMTSGNYGLSDLIAALHWVKINAQHFGGDPHHVTLLGHQSGASLVMALLSSHLSKGLFNQVWTSGGSPLTSLITVQEAEIQNEKFMKEMGCTSIECLHNKGPEELLESVPNDWRMFHQDLPNRGDKRHHWLVRDGIILREKFEAEEESIPRSQLPAEALGKIPFVAGAPAEVDASLEMFSYLNWNDTTKFSAYLESSLGSFGPSLSREVIDRYFRPESTPWQTFASLLSDVRTICPMYYAANARADPYTQLPVYFYVATQRKSTPTGDIADSQADIGAILGTYVAETSEEKKFVGNMQKLFYEFVEKGELPGAQDVTKSILKVDENIQKIFTYPNCDFWQEHQFYPHHGRID